MKSPNRAVAWLLPLLLTGCFHKIHQLQTQALAPPIVITPPPAAAPPPAQPQPPVAKATSENTAPPPAKPPEKPAKHTVHHRKQANKDVEEASNAAPEVSAIGQLTPGDPSDLQRQTEESIMSTERGLTGISRKLSDQEEKTVAQIREFLKQAKAAMASGDMDGAQTLALKAKVLFDEIKP